MVGVNPEVAVPAKCDEVLHVGSEFGVFGPGSYVVGVEPGGSADVADSASLAFESVAGPEECQGSAEPAYRRNRSQNVAHEAEQHN